MILCGLTDTAAPSYKHFYPFKVRILLSRTSTFFYQLAKVTQEAKIQWDNLKRNICYVGVCQTRSQDLCHYLKTVVQCQSLVVLYFFILFSEGGGVGCCVCVMISSQPRNRSTFFSKKEIDDVNNNWSDKEYSDSKSSDDSDFTKGRDQDTNSEFSDG